MGSARWLLLAALGLGAFLLDKASREFAAGFLRALEMRRAVLTAPASARRQICEEPPANHLLRCHLGLTWWRGNRPEDLCLAEPPPRAFAVRRRYRLAWQCRFSMSMDSAALADWELPLLTTTLIR